MTLPWRLSTFTLLTAALPCTPALAQDFGPAAIIDDTGLEQPVDVMATDFDGDGDLDLVGVGGPYSKGSIYWYEMVQDGLFEGPVRLYDGGILPELIRMADLDGDGDEDVVIEDSFQRYLVYERRGPEEIEWMLDLGFHSSPSTDVQLVDMDGDGDLDVLVGVETSQNALFWFANLGGGAFGTKRFFPQAINYVYDFEATDFDGDGILDVLLSHTGTGGAPLAWLRGLGGGIFAPTTTLFNGVMILEFDLADLDGDGDLDVLYRAASPDRMEVLRNDGGGALTSVGSVASLPTHSLHEIQVGDFDGDGLPDALFVMEPPLTFAWCKNLGSLQFAPMAILPGAPQMHVTTPILALVEDLDGDGDQDLIYNSPTPPLLVWQDSFPKQKDCNGNGVPDSLDLSSGTSLDCNGNLVPDECDALHAPFDIDGDLALDACFAPPLMADVYELSVSTGGVQTFQVQSPGGGPLSLFLLLGSASGVSPGIPIDGHVLPLNLDAYLQFTLQSPSTMPLASSLGSLPISGVPAQPPMFQLPPAFDGSLIGMTIHHAYVQFDLFTGAVGFASNPVPLTFLP
ncbi:MAG: VCBS repeat-containing protein [Planctomycetota bacterium]|nr:VCBS repeat-containing protein [Planctomycetota bacterium]